jgi:NADH:ubiquinone oxidoreductase subunit 6 (subunit J)
MKKLQKWLGIATVLFVAVYIGAIMITVKSQISVKDRQQIIEPAREYEEEKHLILPELFLPMGILLALACCYLIVRKRNTKKYDHLDDDMDKAG